MKDRFFSVQSHDATPTKVVMWVVLSLVLGHIFIGGMSLFSRALGQTDVPYMPFWHDPYIHFFRWLSTWM